MLIVLRLLNSINARLGLTTVTDFISFVQQYGLAIGFLLFALITGSMGKWYFSSYVKDMKGQYEDRIADKNKQISDWKEIAESNGAIAKDNAHLSEQMKETLDKIYDELRPIRRPSGS